MAENQAEINNETSAPRSSNSIVFAIIVVLVVATFIYLFFIKNDQPEKTPAPEPIVVEEPVYVEPTEEVVEVVEEVVEPVVSEPVEVKEPIVLPDLDQSDEYMSAGIALMSWRKELLTLLVTDDLVRRLVVFTDNFAQGEIAYSHLPLQPLPEQFATNKQSLTEDTYVIAGENELRYKQYIELLHSFEPKQLANYFNENKPLFAQAYAELGYGDKTFDQVLQQALNRILDLQINNTDELLVRPSVVYQYQQQELEQLPAADKFLLRLGKENLLQLKAIALELNNQLQL
ncbi:DUF3014 domain-containing protein [Thalassomonas sp. M1454]|uniref:DUF3014 domain-containing protein n=1 Tax=Thalassomonas sp. M1454 TaxID=2594477 RepID=UPI00117F3890|nr:DUF3014 domain-containing protein [Thalassomonas sp. M1454]TRX57240.1 DUF3014 domain-containing protein [Thalassomonas sp. M1454]